MGNMIYNGVELPALPEWDKTKYPYAVIEIVNPESASWYYVLTVHEYHNILAITYPDGDKHFYYGGVYFASNVPPDGWIVESENPVHPKAIIWYLDEGDTAWGRSTGSADTWNVDICKEKTPFCSTDVLWTNFNLNYSDGTLYCAASEPIPVATYFLSGMAMGLTGKGDPTFEASDAFTKGYLAGAALRRKRVGTGEFIAGAAVNSL